MPEEIEVPKKTQSEINRENIAKTRVMLLIISLLILSLTE